MGVEFRVDPATKQLVKVTEATTTPDELRAELQVAADEAQNRLNAATSNKEQTAANLVAAGEADEAACAEVEAAEDGVKSSSAQLSDLAAAESTLAELAGATPETENATDAGSGEADSNTTVDETAEAHADSTNSSVQEQTVETHVAENTPA